jgi:hypothetical protein
MDAATLIISLIAAFLPSCAAVIGFLSGGSPRRSASPCPQSLLMRAAEVIEREKAAGGANPSAPDRLA